MEKPQVTVQQGILEGVALKTQSGFSYNGFLGVPYAKPPIGNLRFKEPQPSDHWDGVRDATVEGNVNCQIDPIVQTFTGSEDSLYLNVFVPESATADSDLPVMYFIHGGAFSSGSGSKEMYGPSYFVDKNVIMVTVNSRLGPLGFLCLHTAECPGNAGLKDQVMALKWVNENIKYFGGNANNITVFGQSSGAGTAHFLTMSPLAKGLFSKAIFQSGSSAAERFSQSDPESVAFKLGELLGFKTDPKTKADLLSFLTNVPVKDLITAAQSTEFSVGLEIAFAPVIEKSYSLNTAIITENPRELLKSGNFNQVPTITGFTSNEGVINETKLYGMNLETVTVDQLIPDFQAFIPKDLKLKLNATEKYVAANKIKDFYFDNEEKLVEKYFALWSDFTFTQDADYSVKMFSNVVPSTYYYRFSYEGALNIMKLILRYPYVGAAHSDDVMYFFKPEVEGGMPAPTALDIRNIKRVTEMWTNFAKFGNPTPEVSDDIETLWKPVTKNEINCYDISEELTLIQNPFQERAKFWEDLNNM